MSAGPSLYRRHRPRTFAEVVGQEHVVRTLSHAIERGRIHHAYLFVGSRGTGKTSMAKILAACLNCEHGPTTTPCGSCESCVSIANATSLDVIEMDAASNNSVDDIRELRESVAYAPISGRHKVYILDEAHMLSTSAWNAFLKTLEEPPPRTVFVLATTEPGKVLPTVVDRCHRFNFVRPSAEQVAVVVRRVAESEGVALEDGVSALIARHATGSFRDALGTLEQLITYTDGAPIGSKDVLDVLGVTDAEQLFAALDAVISADPAQALRSAGALVAAGREPTQVLHDLEAHARDLLTVQILGGVPAELRVTAEHDARLLAQARALAQSDVVRLLDLVAGALQACANDAQPRIQLELALIKAAAPATDASLGALLVRIERLERGRPAPPPGAGPEGDAGGVPLSVARLDLKDPQGVDVRNPQEVGVSDINPASVGGFAREDDARRREPAPHHAAREQPEPGESVHDEPERDQRPLELSRVVSSWPAVVQLVRDANAMLAVVLQSAQPVAVSERELVLSFAPDAEFYKRKAEQDEHRRAATEAVRSVLGVSLAIRYELAEQTAPAEGAQAREPQPLSTDELVQRFVEEFDAEEISDTDEEAES